MVTGKYFRAIADAAGRRLWLASVKVEAAAASGSRDERRIAVLHRRLGVPAHYVRRGLPFHPEARETVAVACGLAGALHHMTPETCEQWGRMKAAAAEAGITLAVRWAFRSIDDQAVLLRKYLRCGKQIDELLTWIAAPGYSEHHSGRALDFEPIPRGTPFEHTSAFAWLCEHAGIYGFAMSYPQDNDYGLVFEPWHWCFQERT
ncbi:D-alanyl-D-alanine carboxypeptidase family protein [Aromatoleum buckelii]|uniref:D-alanyl-D-alanine carboxypeptidase family protein n=1 Tax=Aromatoleum buckelii TaxID=200254 RepID=A0ABX1N863_9RHOO|nr:D-alanyl-D-alanine carboxypeptidase family protein [Aromatoleum buckelii]MCK0510754.1 D-alanyl-D-alanine carboxypeptidase family protein [Aromatoleum buckelii]